MNVINFFFVAIFLKKSADYYFMSVMKFGNKKNVVTLKDSEVQSLLSTFTHKQNHKRKCNIPL